MRSLSLLVTFVATLMLLPFASALKYIQTSSLLTCMENSQFSASFFDVTFFPHNRSAIFNVDATTTISEKVVAKAELIVYGLNVLNKKFDLCELKENAVCPLSAGRIEVKSSYTLDKDNDLTKKIPGIAYTVPDLDAQVRVIAYSSSDTAFATPLACVQAVLSNGKTVQTKYASWAIAAISGLGVLTSAIVSVIGHSTTAAHIASNSISLFVYFQNLAITSMMGVARVPPIAAAWTQNFQWSMGIINVKFLQDIFDWYVKATGGTPVVVVSNKDILSVSVQKRGLSSHIKDFARKSISNIQPSIQKRTLIDSGYDFSKLLSNTELYTTNERNTTDYSTKVLVLTGIKRVAYLGGIELSNVFLTGIVFTLFFLFCMVVGMAVFKAVIELLTKAGYMKETSKFYEYRRSWGSIIKGTLYRICIIAFPQVSILSIWEFTQRDSVAVVLDAVAVLAIISILLVYGVSRVVLRGRESTRLYKTPAYMLYGDSTFLNRFGFLYVQFKAELYWWLMPLLGYTFLRSLFVAVLQGEGKPQAMIVFIIELAHFVALCWARPYLDKRTNAFNIVIHALNLFNSLLFLFFSNLFGQPSVVSSVMAVILFVVNAVFALFLMIFTIVTCVLALVYKNPDARYQPMKDDRVSFIPKVQPKNDAGELFDLGRTVMNNNDGSPVEFEMKHPNSSARLLFDEDIDESNSTYDVGSQSRRFDSGSVNEPLQPTSAVMGDNTTNYARIPAAPSGNLRKPETSFSTNTQYQGYSGSNPYLNENPSYTSFNKPKKSSPENNMPYL